MSKNVVVLGSTGSIGANTLEVIRKSEGKLKLFGVSAHSNREGLEKQVAEFKVPHSVLTSEKDGNQKILDLVAHADTDVVVVAIVGFAALRPVIAAIQSGKRIALANKEALVTCGEILNSMARKYNSTIIPVDSEHNALFQALQGHPPENIEKIWLTGSGGPFRGKNRKELESVDIKSALKHPNWKMGPKISIDSATLMNKGLEFIEARWIFDIDPKKIDVIIHPQSLVHGLIEFIDNSWLAHLSTPDMKGAISYALYHPERQHGAMEKLRLDVLKKLEFEAVDYGNFPCIGLAQTALKTGGIAPTVLNAANEVAVKAFLEEKIRFLDIPDLIFKTLEKAPQQNIQLEGVFDIDLWARSEANENIASLST
jgi:1-deoxy-D-xylulose-5-phosphate reductoisomerase